MTPGPGAGPAAGCPKCGRPAKETDAACARCGLLRERWASYDGRPAPHALIDPLWEQALADWDNEKRHSAMAALVQTDWAALSALSQRYHVVLRERPDDKLAAAALDRLIQAALRLPPPAKSAVQPTVVKVVRGAFGVVLIVLSVLLFIGLMRRGR